MERRQNTIGKTVELPGRALFSGREVTLRLCPAEPSTGIVFVRTDLPDKPVVPATVEAVGQGFQCTLLRWNEVEIRSVEHLLSACMGLRVDNLLVEINADEMPACGGCAAEFAEAILKAGVEEQGADRQLFEITQAVMVSEGNATIAGMQGEEGLTLSYVFESEAGSVPPQVVTCSVEPESFLKELAPARTFADQTAYEEFQKRKMGGGVTDENAIVIFQDGTLRTAISRREARPRFKDEFARHKLVDLLGDLALAGLDVQGRIVAVRSGHRLNASFASRIRTLATQKGAPAEYLDIREIQRVLPHRYPFLMVDRILRIEGDDKIVGLKNVSMNEHYFQGHLPEYPVMPGVLQLEALAQVAGVLVLRKLEHSGKLPMLVGMDNVRLRRAVLPGDQLMLEAEALRVDPRLTQVKARATVNGEVTCEAEMKFRLVDPEVL